MTVGKDRDLRPSLVCPSVYPKAAAVDGISAKRTLHVDCHSKISQAKVRPSQDALTNLHPADYSLVSLRRYLHIR